MKLNNDQNITQPQDLLSDSLLYNSDRLKSAFGYPDNVALKIRTISIPSLQKEGMIFFLEGAADPVAIEDNILKPLSGRTIPDEIQEYSDPMVLLAKLVLTSLPVNKISAIQVVVDGLLNGKTILMVEGTAHALSMDTQRFEHRTVSKPAVENAIRGPKEAFIESLAVNRSLMRKHVRNENLYCEIMTVGERASSQICIMYIKDLANPEIVQLVKLRISQIQSDALHNLSILEQHIEDRSYSIIPSTLLTERPDRAAGFLLEGYVALLMDNSPYALIIPITFWSFFQTGEDTYMRWPDGNFSRIMRLIAMAVAMLTPAIYISVTTFHVEMIPTDMMLAIAAARERVPFPIIIEILFMEISFEILREAGIRVPTVIGPTIGIVGALILGQAAVEANIVSPILVIIVAVTGLASFSIPDISFNFMVRILRFTFLFIATILGFYGMGLLMGFLLAYAVSIKSFEVPFMAPMAPHQPSSKDLFFRPPLWKQWLRPASIHPQDPTRQKKPRGN